MNAVPTSDGAYHHVAEDPRKHSGAPLEEDFPPPSGYLPQGPGCYPTPPLLHRGDALLKSNRSSHGSDTSSAYSGSDALLHSAHSSIDDPVDLSGLMESAVDSDDEEELSESIESLNVRDTVKECLEKDPCDRNECDIEILLEFMQHLPAFANMRQSVRRALCTVMVFAVVEKAGTVVMSHGEELDSWSVIVNGSVEVELPDGSIHELHLGDSFGITGEDGEERQMGTMRTKTDDCQFVLVAREDFLHIQSQCEENIRHHEEDGEVVLVTEHRPPGHHIVIRGTPEHLMRQLVEEQSLIDKNYVEDFLLTYRTFIPSPRIVASNLLNWFQDHPNLRDKVARVVLIWVSSHFPDFETDPEMMDFLEKMETCLENNKMVTQLKMLNLHCANKARSRTVTLARSTRDDVLHFSILGGYERGFGIFISKVAKPSKADEVGLRRGDQILEVNGHSFERVSHARALEILRGTTHLSITVKTNWLDFKEMLNTPENSPRQRKIAPSDNIVHLQSDPRARFGSCSSAPPTTPSADWPLPPPVCFQTRSASLVPELDHSDMPPPAQSYPDPSKDIKKGFMTIGHRRARLKKALAKINLISKSLNSETQLNSSDDSLYSSQSGGSSGANRIRGCSPQRGASTLYHSQSNPDLTSLDCGTDYPEHVLKVYRSDQSCKYLLVHKETTAHEVVMLALREFGITDPSSDYALCEVTAAEGGMLKQRRLPDHLQNLAERISLASRYYLKNNASTEPLVPDDLASDLLRETQVHLLQLNSTELAAQLTLEDFTIFRQIEPTEYIDDLFEIQSPYGTPMLSNFAQLVNKEMFWVVTEVCSEHNASLRAKIIKHFIKVARQCKECRNFNSMFAILSGLGHGAVSRLRQAWEKLPSKYIKIFEDLQDVMDPSRNMCKYRNLINSEVAHPPIIPFYPVVRKDLAFIHFGNDTKIGGLVNFEKLRMIAKEVHQLMKMCSAPYDLVNMFDVGGGLTTAMAALNSHATNTQAATVHRRRKKSVTQLNPKKMFEEAQMVRRVKAYLSNLRIITDEEKLHALSLECEPLTGGATTAPSVPTVPTRRRHPSPTLSSASSTSNTSETKKPLNTKFGTNSPQAMRKLLSLADQTKIRPQRQGNLASALNNRHYHSLSPSPNALRRPVSSSRHQHGRSHSDTKPVDLSAESSSVSAAGLLRKSNTSSDSLTTTTTTPSVLYETDSGVGSATDNSPSGSNYSPSALTRTSRHLESSQSGPPYTTSIHVPPPYPVDFPRELEARLHRPTKYHQGGDYTISFKVNAVPAHLGPVSDHHHHPHHQEILNYYNCDDDDDDDEGKEAAV